MELRLQKCEIDQLAFLVSLSRNTFVDAFEKDNNPEDFENYLDFAFNPDRIADEVLDADSDFYFVYLNKDVVGYFKLNQLQVQTDIKDDYSLELERIYVLKEFQGKQIGRWMLEEVKALAREKEKTFVWLGVWEHNIKAIAFYETYGFQKFGTHPYYIGTDKQTDWLMRINII
ncbi:GNAT family N-acetyltransferase [Sediminicola arcticus]|jgi:ribosomal protein S18 acetylase RimI-like enzyme|uniref:GNAT family N-acetyltransferase n=1 Tax=Sediminicola arcticus TaxID=1574308 RepID=A0ABV2SR16_9FLAO